MWGTQKETHLKISDQRYFLFFLINYKYFFHLSKILKEFSQLLNLLHSSGIIHSQSTPSHILNPRALMHSLWASIRCPQCSSPFSMMLSNKLYLLSNKAGIKHVSSK